MGSMRNLMLGAAVLTGAAGLASVPAQAAQIGIYVGVHRDYVPPSPGMGYFWTAGYMNGGYWVPGRWVFRGYGYRAPVVRRDFDRDHFRGGDFDRHDRYVVRERDHFRR